MNESDNKYLIFSADGRSFSISFSDVQIIIPACEPQKIPDFPDYAPGTVVNGGKVVTVISIRRRFGYTDRKIADRDCIIVCTGEKSIGLLCDSISGFREVPPEEIQPAPDINSEANARFISGEFLLDGSPCYILKPELIIKEEDDGRISCGSSSEKV